jgi:hypothetical protein
MADVQKRLSTEVSILNLEGIKSALRDGADANYRGGEVLLTVPFHDYSGNMKEVLKILLDSGADPNYVIPQIEYPILSHAAHQNSNGVVEMLLKAGADPNVPYGRYKNVLDQILESKRILPSNSYDRNINVLCQVTNYDEVERLKKKYPENQLNCQMSKADISKNMGAVETALDKAAIRAHPEQTPYGVHLPHVMEKIKGYAYKNVGPGGRRRKTKKRKSSKKKTKKRK